MKHTNEEAVSPVIGVILMVAITVILAAVIASFVFGIVPTMQKTKMVAVTAHQQDAGNITVTYLGGQDVQSFQSAVVNVTEDSGTTFKTATLGSAVGNSVIVKGTFTSNNHVVVTALFTDQSQQVILDTYI